MDHLIESASPLTSHLMNAASGMDGEPAEVQRLLAVRIEDCRSALMSKIDGVPIEITPELIDQGTPLSTYFRLRDVIATATRRIHYFDRYLNVRFFDLYLRDVGRSLEIRLATTAGDKGYGVQNVVSVSQLAAQEFADFQLLEVGPAELHDRNLRIDDDTYTLGASIKDAGRYPTNLAKADGSLSAQQILDGILSNGKRIV